MALGIIVIDTSPVRTDSDICDDLLACDVLIAELGTRPAKFHRRRSISEALSRRPERWGNEDDDVGLLTYVVNSEGCICTYDTIDDLDNCDEFDVLFLTGRNGVSMNEFEAGIEKMAVEWRKKGRPSRYYTYFECEDCGGEKGDGQE